MSCTRIDFFDFEMDKSIVAPIIYGENPQSTTNRGVIIPRETKQELKTFLSGFNTYVGTEQIPYYRIDAYFVERTLWILEINASFVDGWGTALNLARASGIKVDPAPLIFPKRFVSVSKEYLPELNLFVAELSALNLKGHSVCENSNGIDLIYVYGRIRAKNRQILPYDGLRLDNKINLGLFSREWNGNLVKVPRHYINRFESWEDIPLEVALKFCDKGSHECEQARQSVMFNKPLGRAPFIKQCYKEEKLLAQDIVCSTKQGGDNCQLIILAIGNEPITGYVQYSRKKIINDNSTHGPMRIN